MQTRAGEEDGVTAENTKPEESLDLDPGLFREGDIKDKASIRVPEKNNPFGKNKTVEVAVIDGKAIFEGDIALDQNSEPVSRGIAIKGDKFRWPGAVMPYVADPVVKELAEAAMKHWESKTKVRFRQRTNEKDFVHFKRLQGSWSFVGRQGGEQELSLGVGCTLGSAIHEIGHALGLWHEQSRGDRDKHISVRLENVAPANRHNFEKHIEDGMDIGAYDFGSIMHYPATAFSVDGSVTIQTIDGQAIGQREGLSSGDIAAIANLYP